MNVTIILVAYHGDVWLPACLRTLASASTSQLRLVLVDNTGNTVIKDLDLSAFQVEVISTPRPMGFAEANNYALVQASRLDEVIVFLNQDTVSRTNWLLACVECLESNQDVAAITPLTRNYELTGWEPYFLECAQKSYDYQNDIDQGTELSGFYETPVIPAAAMIVRLAVLEQTGPFDVVYGSYYEDYDLCRRIRSAGYKIGVCAEGEIGHYSGSATNTRAAENKRARWVTRNRVIDRQREIKGSRLLGLLQYLIVAFPRNLLRSLLRRPGAKPLVPFLQAHGDLVRIVPRLVSRRYDEARWHAYLEVIGWRQVGMKRG